MKRVFYFATLVALAGYGCSSNDTIPKTVKATADIAVVSTPKDNTTPSLQYEEQIQISSSTTTAQKTAQQEPLATLGTETLIAEPEALETVLPVAIANTETNSNKNTQAELDNRLINLLQTEAPKTQIFTISGKESTVVKGEKGAKIYIDPTKLETTDGRSYSGPIKVELIEMQSTVDMLFANAPTVSNGQLLESGGTYYINCTTNSGDELRIKQGETIKLDLPHVGRDSMDIFAGEKAANGTINWQLTNDSIKSVRRSAYYIAMDYYKRSKTRTHYNRKTREVVIETKSYDESDWTETKRVKLNAMERLFTVKKRLKKEFTNPYFLSTVNIDSSYNYQRFSEGKIYANYRQKAKQIANGIRPSRTLDNMFTTRKKNIGTTIHQIDNRAASKNLYVSNISGFGWINCDRYPALSRRTDIIVQIPKEQGNTAYRSYVLFKSLKGIVSGWNTNDGNIKFDNIPAGEIVLVVVSEKDGHINADIKEIDLKKALTYTPEFTQMASTNDLRNKIEDVTNP